MSMTIELNPAEQARLDAAAKRAGLRPVELAREVLAEHLPVGDEPEPEDPTLALFLQWEAEGTARTVEEAEQENELWERFQANVNRTRASMGMRQL